MRTTPRPNESEAAGSYAGAARQAFITYGIWAAMGRRSSPRIQRLKGRLAVAGLRLLSHVPTGAAYAVAEVAGRAAASLPLPPVRVANTNLAQCFPQLSRDEVRRLARRSLVESMKAGVDMATCWFSPDRALARVQSVVGEREGFDQTVCEGRPVVLLAPHLGCWEAANYWFGSRYRFHALFKPSPLPAVDELIGLARQRFGTELYPANARGVAGLVRALRRGGVTAILPDQVPARDAGRFAPFFGRPAWTGTLAARLIQRTGARAFVVFARRASASGWELVLRDPDPELYDEDLDRSLCGLNRSLESAIREEPEQYLWCYRRFRRRPAGFPNVYA